MLLEQADKGISLAERQRNQLPKNLASEVGVSGDTVVTGFNNEEVSPDKLTIADYRKMLDNDATIRAVYNVIRLPILANEWDIEPDEDDKNSEQADFVKDCLNLPPHKGGMTTPFNLVMADMLRSLVEGFRLFEKVWRYDEENNKLVIKKLAPRDASTITLKRDDNGGFDGATQRATGVPEGIDIPLEKCFLFTNNKDENWLYGQSAFKSAFYHYDKKHKLYYIQNVAAQVAAIAPKVIKASGDASPEDIKKNQRAIDRLGLNASVVLPDGYEIDAWEVAKNRVDLQPAINHHDTKMMMVALAQWLGLGANNKTGSFALSKDHSDIFVLSLKGLMQSIEDHINHYIIPDLINYNFEDKKYPTFKFADMTDSTAELMEGIFTKLVEKGNVDEKWILGISEKVATRLGLDGEELDKQLAALKEKEAKENADLGIQNPTDPTDPAVPDPKNGVTPPKNPKNPNKPEEGKVPKTAPASLSEDVGDTPAEEDWMFYRPLSQSEIQAGVRFAEIETTMNRIENDYDLEARDFFDDVRSKVLMKVQTIVNEEKWDEIEEFKIDGRDEYVKLLTAKATQAYEYGKRGASAELKVGNPATPGDSKDYLNTNAVAIADKQFSDLEFLVRTKLLNEQSKVSLSEDKSVSFSLVEVASAIGAGFDSFFTATLALTAVSLVSKALNKGRDDVFGQNKDKISLYQFSAILDGRTCPTCQDLDGTVVTGDEYRMSQWNPPIHFGCRCIWVAIHRDSEFQPRLNPFPLSPGGMASPSLSESAKVRVKKEAAHAS